MRSVCWISVELTLKALGRAGRGPQGVLIRARAVMAPQEMQSEGKPRLDGATAPEWLG